MSEYHAHDGRGMPVDPETLVHWQCRHEAIPREKNAQPAKMLGWVWGVNRDPSDIIAYRIVQP